MTRNTHNILLSVVGSIAVVIVASIVLVAVFNGGVRVDEIQPYGEWIDIQVKRGTAVALVVHEGKTSDADTEYTSVVSILRMDRNADGSGDLWAQVHAGSADVTLLLDRDFDGFVDFNRFYRLTRQQSDVTVSDPTPFSISAREQDQLFHFDSDMPARCQTVGLFQSVSDESEVFKRVGIPTEDNGAFLWLTFGKGGSAAPDMVGDLRIIEWHPSDETFPYYRFDRVGGRFVTGVDSNRDGVWEESPVR